MDWRWLVVIAITVVIATSELVLGVVVAVVAAVVSVGLAVSALQTTACYLVPLWQMTTGRHGDLAPPMRSLVIPPDSDPAVPDYLHGPAGVDLAHVRALASDRFELGWSRWSTRLAGWTHWRRNDRIVAVPLSVAFGIGLALGLALGVLLWLLVWTAHVLVVGVLTVLWRATGLLLRLLDSASRQLRNITMRCVACQERMPYPAYLCPDCGATHWDIRPGRFGIVARTCRCGRRLPTLLILGTAELTARCPYRTCGSEMSHRPGTLPELVLPVFGATGAGKTRLMDALVVALQQRARRPGVSVEFADASTQERLAHAPERLAPDQSTAATTKGLQRGLLLRLDVGGRERLVQLFDAAGERFYTEAGSADLLYLGDGRTYLFVIDPLTIDGFWKNLPADEQERLSSERPVNVPQPDLVYLQTHDRIVELGGKPRRSRLAIVFSRADVLGPAVDRSDPQAWATELGLGGLLKAARLDFPEITLFCTAAVIEDGAIDPSVLELLRWALVIPPEIAAAPALSPTAAIVTPPAITAAPQFTAPLAIAREPHLDLAGPATIPEMTTTDNHAPMSVAKETP